ncbi:MAG: hypothetical protein MJ003_06145 [Paludibacteraceae bacterium]|nr:hypothetical protein [Paludibacteraceae bacterium]
MKTVKFISIALAGALLVLSACKKGDGKEPEPKIDPTSERCNASDYPQVTIGTQTWMAENYRCSKYDTQSEAYNASWLTNNTVPTSESSVYTPYYTDASDKSKWDKKYDYSDNLTDAQIKKLGYIYNWAAAVGVENGEDYGTQPFSGNRQGVCPNGWHIPSLEEWKTLVDYIEKTDGKGTKTAGKHLKTTSGWYDEGTPQTYPQGLDSYSFAGLPAGFGEGSSVCFVGTDIGFWSATPYESNINNAYCRYLNCYVDDLDDSGSNKKYGRSVRCVKD